MKCVKHIDWVLCESDVKIRIKEHIAFIQSMCISKGKGAFLIFRCPLYGCCSSAACRNMDQWRFFLEYFSLCKYNNIAKVFWNMNNHFVHSFGSVKIEKNVFLPRNCKVLNWSLVDSELQLGSFYERCKESTDTFKSFDEFINNALGGNFDNI